MSPRVFEGFDHAPPEWAELAWVDLLTIEEAAEFSRRREACPDLTGGRCCAPGTCRRTRAVVTLSDCYRCLSTAS